MTANLAKQLSALGTRRGNNIHITFGHQRAIAVTTCIRFVVAADLAKQLSAFSNRAGHADDMTRPSNVIILLHSTAVSSAVRASYALPCTDDPLVQQSRPRMTNVAGRLGWIIKGGGKIGGE